MPDMSFIQDEQIPACIERCPGLFPERKPRGYLGMSEIGEPCERKLWFGYHSGISPDIPNHVLRRFRMGEIIEEKLIRDMRKAGYEIAGQQSEYSDFDGKFQGHCDGHIRGLSESDAWHILEIKSAPKTVFNAFKKHGIEANKLYGSKYAGQVQLYMYYSGLRRAVFVVECKDTQRHLQERFFYDRGHAEALRSKAKRIIESDLPGDPISRKSDYWKCRVCPWNNAEWCRRDWRTKRREW